MKLHSSTVGQSTLINLCEGVHVVREKRICWNVPKSFCGHHPCEPRIIDNGWVDLNNDSLRACQPLSRAVE
jgi:hypothetical protein